MKMPRGRCDAWAEKRIAEIPGQSAFISGPFRCDVDYKRLDIGALNRVLPAAGQLREQRGLAGTRTNAFYDDGGPAKPAMRWGNVFLVHRGQSCNKQVSGITRFTGDTAL